MTDGEIIEGISNGNSSVLEQTIEQYSGYVMAVVQYTLGKSVSEQDKEELVADVFFSLWKNSSTLLKDSKLKPWLAVVARNASINKLRSIHHTEELHEDEITIDDSIVTLPAEKNEQATIVQKAIGELSCLDRNLFVRHYYLHQSISNIAEETGMKPSTIKSHLFRGRQTLKTFLSQSGYTL